MLIPSLKCWCRLLALPRVIFSITVPAKAIIARGVLLPLHSLIKDSFDNFDVTASQKSWGDMTLGLALSCVAVTVIVVAISFWTTNLRGAKKAVAASLVAHLELHLSSSRNGSAKCFCSRTSSWIASNDANETTPLVFLLFQHNE